MPTLFLLGRWLPTARGASKGGFCVPGVNNGGLLHQNKIVASGNSYCSCRNHAKEVWQNCKANSTPSTWESHTPSHASFCVLTMANPQLSYLIISKIQSTVSAPQVFIGVLLFCLHKCNEECMLDIITSKVFASLWSLEVNRSVSQSSKGKKSSSLNSACQQNFTKPLTL